MPAKNGKNINKEVTLSCPAGPAQPVEAQCITSGWSTRQLNQFKKLDYVRFTYADIHGIARCRSVPQHHVLEYLTQGVNIYITGSYF